MNNRDRMLRDYHRWRAERNGEAAWNAPPVSGLMTLLAHTRPSERPVDPAALGALMNREAHADAKGELTPAAAARWLSGFDLRFLRELGQFPSGASTSDRFALVFHHQPAEAPHSCLEAIREVPSVSATPDGTRDALSFLSKQEQGTPDGSAPRLLRSASDFTAGVGKRFPEELAVQHMKDDGGRLAMAAEAVCRRLFFGKTPGAELGHAASKEISRYLPAFLRSLAEVLAEAAIPLHRALLPVLACLSDTTRDADGLFFPEEVLAWCAERNDDASPALTRDEVEDVLRDGGALLSPDPAILAVLRCLNAAEQAVGSQLANTEVILNAWNRAACGPPLDSTRIRTVLEKGGCLRWRTRDYHPEVEAVARFITQGPALDTPGGSCTAETIAAWWNSRSTLPIDANQLAPVLSKGAHLTKLDRPVLLVWAWLRSGHGVAADLDGSDAFTCARRILAWWRKIQPGSKHLARWAAKPEAVAQTAGVIALLAADRRAFHATRRTLRLDSRWSLLAAPLDAYVTREFAIPAAQWQNALGAVWRRSGWAFLRLGTHDEKPRTPDACDE